MVKKSLCGTVHDDNCRALGGVAGHAGLFGRRRGFSFMRKYSEQFKADRRHHYSSENLENVKQTGSGYLVLTLQQAVSQAAENIFQI